MAFFPRAIHHENNPPRDAYVLPASSWWNCIYHGVHVLARVGGVWKISVRLFKEPDGGLMLSYNYKMKYGDKVYLILNQRLFLGFLIGP